MAAFFIPFMFSLCILYLGLRFIKDIYKSINYLLAIESSRRKDVPLLLVSYLIIGAFLIVFGAVFYYQVCAATIEDLLKPRYPVEEPILYGIAKIITSLIFPGGVFTMMSIFENEKESLIKFFLISSVVIFVVYLVLRGMMVLP